MKKSDKAIVITILGLFVTVLIAWGMLLAFAPEPNPYAINGCEHLYKKYHQYGHRNHEYDACLEEMRIRADFLLEYKKLEEVDKN